MTADILCRRTQNRISGHIFGGGRDNLSRRGKNLEEASRILHYVVSGRMVGIVSATQTERKQVRAGSDRGPKRRVKDSKPRHFSGCDQNGSCFQRLCDRGGALGDGGTSDRGILYTSVAEMVIAQDRSLSLRMLPRIQGGMVKSLLTEAEQKEGFYHYLASVSDDVGLDAERNVYDKRTEDYPAGEIAHDPATGGTKLGGARGNEGYAIDIVGNLK